MSEPAVVPGGVLTRRPAHQAFTVHLDNFEGPFDLLLGLISKHKLDITEIALAKVTDEFVAHLRAMQSSDTEMDLEQTSEFLLVAATLLDLKAARLLPQGEVDDEEDLALLEARDLLFARLLQYRAFKQVAAWIERTLTTEGDRYARPGGLEPEYAGLLPEVTFTLGPEEFAALAASAMEPKAVAEVSLAHVHAAKVSVAEQAHLIADRLRRSSALTFRALTGDAPDTLTVIARFLALLELFRSAHVAFEQVTPLGELTVRWTGEDAELTITDEYDEALPPQEDEQ